MTKKVLISLDELVGLYESACCDELMSLVVGAKLMNWFNSKPAAPQWVSIWDRLPGDGEHVLVLTSQNEYLQAKHMRDGIFWQRYFEETDTVNYWMPIPPLPEVSR